MQLFAFGMNTYVRCANVKSNNLGVSLNHISDSFAVFTETVIYARKFYVFPNVDSTLNSIVLFN